MRKILLLLILPIFIFKSNINKSHADVGISIGADIEIAEKYAAENIAALEVELAKPDLTPDQKINIKKSIAENKNALSHSAFEKAFSSIAYGGIAMYAERFGTLSYVNGLNRWASTAGMVLAKKTLYNNVNRIFNWSAFYKIY